jgi:hypothetical protein
MPLSGADTDCDALYMTSLLWIGWGWGFDEGRADRRLALSDAVGSGRDPDKGGARQGDDSQSAGGMQDSRRTDGKAKPRKSWQSKEQLGWHAG